MLQNFSYFKSKLKNSNVINAPSSHGYTATWLIYFAVASTKNNPRALLVALKHAPETRDFLKKQLNKTRQVITGSSSRENELANRHLLANLHFELEEWQEAFNESQSLVKSLGLQGECLKLLLKSSLKCTSIYVSAKQAWRK